MSSRSVFVCSQWKCRNLFDSVASVNCFTKFNFGLTFHKVMFRSSNNNNKSIERRCVAKHGCGLWCPLHIDSSSASSTLNLPTRIRKIQQNEKWRQRWKKNENQQFHYIILIVLCGVRRTVQVVLIFVYWTNREKNKYISFPLPLSLSLSVLFLRRMLVRLLSVYRVSLYHHFFQSHFR